MRSCIGGAHHRREALAAEPRLGAGRARSGGVAPIASHRDRRRGSILPLFALIGLLLFGVATISLSLGQAFVAREQLRTIADAGARAAIAMVRDGQSEASATIIARQIAARTVAIQGGVFFFNDDVVFGDYDYGSRRFTPGGDEFAPAVRVRARPTWSNVLGVLKLDFGLYFANQSYAMETRTIATVGCREVVFAVDSSGGMVNEHADALQLVRDFKAQIDARPRAGDKMGLVYYAADGPSLIDLSRGSPFWAGGTPDPLTRLGSDGQDIEQGANALELEGTCQQFRDRLPGAGRGSCAGKGDHLAIDAALELFERMGDESCSIPRERLIVLITSDKPCAVFGPAINDFATPYYGGTTSDAFAAANRAAALGVTIAPVWIDRGPAGGGNYCRNQPLAVREPGPAGLYLNALARGFVESAIVVRAGPNDFGDLLDGFNKSLAVRVVE